MQNFLPDFNLDCGTFSKLILKAAGNSIQQQCQTLHSKGVSINQVGVTTGGEMINPVKHVFHMTANNFTDNTSCIIVKFLKKFCDIFLFWK